MRKQFVKVMLFGALAFATSVSFVGCKDYDDDISGLETSIASTKTDLESKLSAVNSSISSLQTAQASVQTAINSAKSEAITEAQKAALEAQKAAIASSLESMNQLKSTLEAAIATNTAGVKANKESIEALNAKAASVEADLSGLTGKLQALEAMMALVQSDLSALEGVDGSLGEINASLEIINTSLGDALTSIQTAEGRIATVESTLGTLSDDVKDAFKQLGEQQKTLEGQLESIKALQELTGTLSSNNESVQKDLTSINADLERLKELLGSSLDEGSAVDFDQILKTIDGYKEDITALGTKLDNQVNMLKTLYRSMITNIRLVKSGIISAPLGTTIFKPANEKDGIFGEGYEGAITVPYGKTYNSEASFMVQVVPSNAILTADMLSLMTSDGNDLSQFVNITTEAYEEPLTISQTRAASASIGGIWKVKVILKDNYDADAFKKAIGNGTYAFALAATDIPEKGQEARTVASEYRINVNTTANSTSFNIDYTKSTLNGVALQTILNSSNGYLPVYIGESNTLKVVTSGDNPLWASLLEYSTQDAYALEIYNSVYGTTGIGTVSQTNEFTFKVNKDVANGNYIQLKLSALGQINTGANNALNTTTDYFMLFVSKRSSSSPKLNVALAPNSYLPTTNPTDETAITAFDGNINLTSAAADINNLRWGSYNVTFKDAQNANIFSGITASLYDKDGGSIANLNTEDNIKKVAKVKLSGVELNKIPDNKSVTGSLNFMNQSGVTIISVPVTLTKTMPAFPSAFKFLENAADPNGVVTIYPTSSEINSGNVEYPLNKALTGFTGCKFTTTVSGASFPNNTAVKATLALVSGKAITTSVKYDFGFISSEKDNNGAYKTWEQSWSQPLSFQFASMAKDAPMAWISGKAFALTFGSEKKDVACKDVINYNCLTGTKSTLFTDNSSYITSIVPVVKTENGEDYYFTTSLSAGKLTFTPKADITYPVGSVTGKLVFKITDVFGISFDKSVDITINK